MFVHLSLLHEEAVHGFLLLHKQSNLPIQIHKEGAAEATHYPESSEPQEIVRHNDFSTARGTLKRHWPHRSEGWKLLQVKGKVHPVFCCVKSHERLWEREELNSPSDVHHECVRDLLPLHVLLKQVCNYTRVSISLASQRTEHDQRNVVFSH